MPTITCVEDLRQLYRRRVPRMFCDYAESGSCAKTTFRQNEADFREIEIRQRVGVVISTIGTSTLMGDGSDPE